jgi:hypothetical protein
MAMLCNIPRHPRKIDTNTLLQRLETVGFDITILDPTRYQRSIEHPAANRGQRPSARLVASGRRSLPLAFLDPQAALTFHLVERHLNSSSPDRR